MANPYGITEVDIPGALRAAQEYQNNRIQQMLARSQMETAERGRDRQQRFDEILLGNATRPTPDGKTGSQPAAQSPAAGAYGMGAQQPAHPQGAPAASAQAPVAAPNNGVNVSPEVMRQLAVLDPERANQISTALRGMDTAQRERLQAANLYLANAAQHLRNIRDPAQRQAEIQRITPDLIAHGVSQEQIQGFTPDDRNLDYIVQSAMDVAHLAEVANPRPMVEPQGGRIIDVNRNDPQTGQPRVISESPTMMVGGDVYARPQTTQAPVTRQARNRQTGQVETLQQNPQTGQWEPVAPQTSSSATPAWATPVDGGAGPGQQGFR